MRMCMDITLPFTTVPVGITFSFFFFLSSAQIFEGWGGCKAGALPVVFVDVDAGFPHVDS